MQANEVASRALYVHGAADAAFGLVPFPIGKPDARNDAIVLARLSTYTGLQTQPCLHVHGAASAARLDSASERYKR